VSAAAAWDALSRVVRAACGRPCTPQDSKGVFAAREFVWWYNGHPDQQHLPVDLSRVESVAVCGIGNVALDCARVLLRPVQQLAGTDIAPHALQQLQRSRVRQVQLCARRGPVQVRCAVPRDEEAAALQWHACVSTGGACSRAPMCARFLCRRAMPCWVSVGRLHSQGAEGAGADAQHTRARAARPDGCVGSRPRSNEGSALETAHF
jgi:hypothetical protein